MQKSSQNRQRDAAALLYGEAVAAARQPRFYADLGVPDTVDGRYEMIVLHVFLLVRRLRRETAESSELAQIVFDLMFADMDESLREMGAGDLGVGKKVKRMAKGFYGRAQAYEAAMAAGHGALQDALARNLFGTVEPSPQHVEAMAEYLLSAARQVEGSPLSEFLEGKFRFAKA